MKEWLNRNKYLLILCVALSVVLWYVWKGQGQLSRTIPFMGPSVQLTPPVVQAPNLDDKEKVFSSQPTKDFTPLNFDSHTATIPLKETPEKDVKPYVPNVSDDQWRKAYESERVKN